MRGPGGGGGGGGGGVGIPLFSDQINHSDPKVIFETIPHYLRVWMTATPPPLLSEGLDRTTE